MKDIEEGLPSRDEQILVFPIFDDKCSTFTATLAPQSKSTMSLSLLSARFVQTLSSKNPDTIFLASAMDLLFKA